ncbi:MAG TPA: HEAT repeat domain-containing protein [Kofleriaceae bacterium]|nr:HEAT repeat domain-containing protein [Kofleriaceae bacterium]
MLASTLALGGSAVAQPKPPADKPAPAKPPVPAGKPNPGKPPGAKPVPPTPPAPPAKPVVVDVAAEIKKLYGADEDKATQGAQRLGETRDPKALAALLDGLALGLPPKAAAAALLSVAKHKSPGSFDTVAGFLHYRDRRVRAAAVAAMGALDDARAIELVLAALHDPHKEVRASALDVIEERKLKRATDVVLDLFKKGDEASARALAAMADADLARVIGEQIGTAPDELVARALGLILLNKDFKGEPARVEVVRTLAKVPGTEAVEQLSAYIESVPANPPRQSRREAEQLVEQRLTGGN